MGSVTHSSDEDIKKELLPVFRLTGQDEPILTFYGNKTEGDVSDGIKFEQYFGAMLYAGSISLVSVGKPCGSGKKTLIVHKLVIVDDSGKDNMFGYDALIDQVRHGYQTKDGSCAVENEFDQYAAVVKSDDHYILLVGLWYGHSEPYVARVCGICDKGVTISEDVREIARKLFKHFLGNPTNSRMEDVEVDVFRAGLDDARPSVFQYFPMFECRMFKLKSKTEKVVMKFPGFFHFDQMVFSFAKSVQLNLSQGDGAENSDWKVNEFFSGLQNFIDAVTVDGGVSTTVVRNALVRLVGANGEYLGKNSKSNKSADPLCGFGYIKRSRTELHAHFCA